MIKLKINIYYSIKHSMNVGRCLEVENSDSFYRIEKLKCVLNVGLTFVIYIYQMFRIWEIVAN